MIRTLACVVLLLPALALGQELPDAPSAVAEPAASPAVILQPQPITSEVKPHRIATPEFVLWAVVANAATIADVESTAWVLRTCPTCREANPIYGNRPSRARMYAINVPVNLFNLWLASYLKNHTCSPSGKECWAWRVPFIALSVVHGAAAAHNFRVP